MRRRENLAVRVTDAVNRPRLREIIRKNRRSMSGLVWDVAERVRVRAAIRRRNAAKRDTLAASRSRWFADIARVSRERDALLASLGV